MIELPQETIMTEDGSHTFYVPELDEYYHSIHGAIQESMHVFINAGLRFLPEKKIRIFEMGFGTGLNALLTLIDAFNNQLSVEYYSIEAYPVSIENAKKLNYTQQLNAQQFQDLFLKMHEAEWNKTIKISENFSLHKIYGKIENTDPDFIPPCNLVYYDAFAPSAQPQLWDESVLQKTYNLMGPSGVLTTYCAKGSFKRTLKAIGFTIEALPGPARKREITRATKNLNQ
jgi:tRNA U34 5-methylaminomethyl-2-thiouridine-forming methyltransferase MnmC